MKRSLLLCLSCVLVLFDVGCRPQHVTAIGPGTKYRPKEREARLLKAGQEMSEEIRSSGAMYTDPVLQTYVQSVMDWILDDREAYRPLTAKVYLIDSPIVNAFCLPNGDVFVHTGALGRMRNEAQLAMLLGHEIAHATHRHAYQAYEDAYIRTGAHSYIAVLGSLGGDASTAISGLSALVTVAAISGYSREREEEADRIGIMRMTKAGYDPAQGPAMFQRMLDAADKKDKKWNFLYATHPKMKARVDCCTKMITQINPEIRNQARATGQDKYLAATAPLIYQEAQRHIIQGKFDLAAQTLSFMTEARPKDPAAYALRGELCRARMQDGDLKAAEDAYNAALKLDPNFALAHHGLGFLCVKENRYQEASRHLTRYLELCPKATDADYVRLYIKQMDAERAK